MPGVGCTLDVVVARKLGAPWQPELAVGAIAPRGVRVLNEDVAWLDISEDEVEQIAPKRRGRWSAGCALSGAIGPSPS